MTNKKNKGNKRKISSKIAAAIAAFLLAGENAWAGYAAGTGASAPLGSATAVGNGARATSDVGVAVGESSDASGYNGVAMGYYAKATNSYSQSLGYNTQALSAYSVALGSQSSIDSNVSNAVALGFGSQATENNTVSIGAGAGTNTLGQPATRRIVNVSNGTATNDAVTVQQLNNAIVANGTTSVTLKNAAGSSTATVYTSAEVDKKIKAQDTAALKTRLDTVQQVVKNDTANATVIHGGTGTTALLLPDQAKGGANTQSGANLG